MDTPSPHEETQELSKQEQLELNIEQLKQEIDEHKEKYIRSLAEMENTRKRMQKERQEMTKFAVDQVITDFLNPLDNFEKALSFADKMSDETRNWAMGFKMILTQLQDVLTEHGVHPFISVGATFSPHFHEAVSVEETTAHPDGYILEEFSRGYKSSERTIRPAKVKVAKHPKQESLATATDAEQQN
jgi:molecular chaperone GrpE